MSTKGDLPDACGDCIFQRPHEETTIKCQRHAPSPGTESDEPVYWPTVLRSGWCGEGSRGLDEDKALTKCEACIYWLSPDGGLKPDFPGWREADWWKGAGWCRRYAPGPSTNSDEAPAQWRVTHYTDGCGNGELIPPPDDSSDSV
jgi:hypothetical protein